MKADMRAGFLAGWTAALNWVIDIADLARSGDSDISVTGQLRDAAEKALREFEAAATPKEKKENL